MVDVDGLLVQVLPTADSDAEELADLAGGLRAELLDVDSASVAPLTAEAAPEGAKGLGDLARLAASPVRDPGRAARRGGRRTRVDLALPGGPWKSASAGTR